MGNKEEKTFTDLFASSKKESETSTKTFSDLLTNNEEKKQTSVIEEKKIETPITFDSIFDKLPEEETKSVSNDVSKTFNQVFDLKEEAKSEPTMPLEVDAEENLNLEKKEEKFVITNDNPFFEKVDIFKEQLDNQNKVEETNNAINFDVNPFMNSEVNEDVQKQNNIHEEVANPFFENNSSTISAEPLKEETINNNPFFGENTTGTNPFFEKDTSNNEQVITNQANLEKNIPEQGKEIVSASPFFTDNIQTNNKEVQKEEFVSASPFFAEEKKTEPNPFFENTISLIENKTPSNKNTRIDTTKSKHYNVKVEKKKEPLIKFIIGVLSYALFIWLLLIGVTLLVYVLDIRIRAAKGDYSSPTFNAYVVLTGSMLPEIQVKDVVVTKKLDATELKEGDVITFASSDSRFLGTIITHRIIKKNYSEKEGYTFQTKGDNNNVADNALVYPNNIYGKVILKIPKLGYLQEFLASDGGWIIVILIPCLAVMSYDTVKLIKGIKRKKYKNIKVQK